MGTADFNHLEVMGLEEHLLASGIDHRVVVFEGPHGWPSFEHTNRALDWMDRHGTLSGLVKRRYFAAAEAIAGFADELAAGVETHRVHGDLHLGNVLFRDGELRVLDFDDMVTGPAVQDLWLALPGRGREVERQRQILLAGYQRFRAFDRSTLRLIEPLRGLRLVRYAGWLARRWHDPAFPLAFPWFNTTRYWEDELNTLREQAERMQLPVLSLS